MSQCIFCKIINKEIPGHILFENEHVLAFLDISQTTKGHTLIIPKKHVEDVFSMNEEDMTHVFSVVPKIANALKTTFNAEGMNIVNNNKSLILQYFIRLYKVFILKRKKLHNFYGTFLLFFNSIFPSIMEILGYL